MINFNLAGDALLHCLKISGAKVVVVDEEERVRTRVKAIKQAIEKLDMQAIVLSEGLKSSIAAKTARRPDDSYREDVKESSLCALFYTRYNKTFRGAFLRS